MGKTELCKAMAQFIFDDKHAFTRVDMSEFGEKHTVSKLIGRLHTINHLVSFITSCNLIFCFVFEQELHLVMSGTKRVGC